MNQREINRQVAQATGESVREISRRGFSLFDTPELEQLEQTTVDWDEVQQSRDVVFPLPQRNEAKVA